MYQNVIRLHYCSDKYSLVSRKVKAILSPEMLWTVFLASKSSKFAN